MHRTARARLALAVLAGSATAVSAAAVVSAQGGPSLSPPLDLTLKDAQGRAVGTVELVPSGRTLDITLRTQRGLRTGFHGFHIHETGRCEGPSFSSAGGHLEREGQDHGAHAGDLPTALVKANGTALLRVTTDLVTLGEVRDADGSAFIVHLGRDNQANVPPRYGRPDQDTRNTGDAGGRAACGVVPPLGQD